jgi:hypothetical protein
LKKPTGSVRFRFYKQKTEKTELNRTKPKLKKKTRKKTEPNRKNRAKPKNEKTEPKPSQTGKTESNQFEPIFP